MLTNCYKAQDQSQRQHTSYLRPCTAKVKIKAKTFRSTPKPNQWRIPKIALWGGGEAGVWGLCPSGDAGAEPPLGSQRAKPPEAEVGLLRLSA